MDYTPLSTDEQQAIRQQFYRVRGEFDQWIQLGAGVLARTAQTASVITPPQAYLSRFKHLELIAIHESTVLLVLVLHDGTVRQQTFTPDMAYQQEELRRVAMYMNTRCGDATVEQIETALQAAGEEQAGDEAQPAHLAELQQLVCGMVVRAMRQLEDRVNRQIYSDGLMEMLSQPEFIPALLKEENVSRAVERMRQILEIMTSSNVLGNLIVKALATDGVQVVIGGEHPHDEMREYSVVLSRYGVDGAVTGVLGIIGPTRMAYPRSISTVDYISSVMSDLLSQVYGSEPRSSTAQQQKDPKE
jgi:heat-inducible transcriptional repressor